MATYTKLICPFRKVKNVDILSWETQPIYHYDDGNYIFFLTNDNQDVHNGIWKYNMNTQIMEEKYAYPQDYNYLTSRRAVLDAENDIIYVLVESTEFILFDLKTKRWNTSLFDDCRIKLFYGNFFMIPTPINQLHFTKDNTHYKLIVNTLTESATIIKLHENIGVLQDEAGYDNLATVLYNKSQQRLFMFQAKCDYLLFCDITGINQQSFNWTKHKIELPFETGFHSSLFGVVLAWDQIMFLFNFDDDHTDFQSIWCLDLINSNKWMRVNYGSVALKYYI
eukprot:231849_1